jgi:hypothetical protein
MLLVLKAFKDMFTETDNVTFDIFRVLLAISVIWFLFLGSYELIMHDHDFNLTEVSGGLTALLGLGGAAIGYKDKSRL